MRAVPLASAFLQNTCFTRSRRRRPYDPSGPVAGGRREPALRGRADPVSRIVLRLDTTAGHPWEIPASTPLPGSKPSWTTVSWIDALADFLDVEGHLGSRLGPPGGGRLLVDPTCRRPLGRERVPGVGQSAIGVRLEDRPARGRRPRGRSRRRTRLQVDPFCPSVRRSLAAGGRVAPVARVSSGSVEPEPDPLGRGRDVGGVSECRSRVSSASPPGCTCVGENDQEGNGAPVSSSVWRLASTAGQPCEAPWSTTLSGAACRGPRSA